MPIQFVLLFCLHFLICDTIMDVMKYSHKGPRITKTIRRHHWSRLFWSRIFASFLSFLSPQNKFTFQPHCCLSPAFVYIQHCLILSPSHSCYYAQLGLPSLCLMSLKPVIGKFDVRRYDEHSVLLISSVIPSNLTAGMHMPTCSSSSTRETALIKWTCAY